MFQVWNAQTATILLDFYECVGNVKRSMLNKHWIAQHARYSSNIQNEFWFFNVKNFVAEVLFSAIKWMPRTYIAAVIQASKI